LDIKNKLKPATDFFKDMSCEVEIEELVLVKISCGFINYRAENHLSQIELAQKLGVNQEKIVQLESGDYNPTVKELLGYVRKLNLKISMEIEEI
jgi:DNA-binding XRE family transcriptional regulator